MRREITKTGSGHSQRKLDERMVFHKCMQALELGVYDHIPGDGREFVCTDPTAVKIRAEDGRAIER